MRDCFGVVVIFVDWLVQRDASEIETRGQPGIQFLNKKCRSGVFEDKTGNPCLFMQRCLNSAGVELVRLNFGITSQIEL